MKTTATVLCLCGALTAVAIPASANPAQLVTASAEEVFTTLDTDQDNMLSIREASQSPNLIKIFIKIDHNQDQYVTREEYQGYKNSQAKKSG